MVKNGEDAAAAAEDCSAEDWARWRRRRNQRSGRGTFGMALTRRTPFTLHSNSKSSSIRIPRPCYLGEGLGGGGRHSSLRLRRNLNARWMLMLIPRTWPIFPSGGL